MISNLWPVGGKGRRNELGCTTEGWRSATRKPIGNAGIYLKNANALQNTATLLGRGGLSSSGKQALRGIYGSTAHVRFDSSHRPSIQLEAA